MTAKSTSDYDDRIAKIKEIAAGKERERELVRNWRITATDRFTRLQKDLAGLHFSMEDLTDLLKMLFTKQGFPEAEEIKVSLATQQLGKETEGPTANFLITLKVGRVGSIWEVSAWAVEHRILVLVKLSS